MNIKYEFRNAVVIMKQALDIWESPVPDVQLAVPLATEVMQHLAAQLETSPKLTQKKSLQWEERRLSAIALLEYSLPDESEDSSQEAIIKNYNTMTQILQLADETYIALSTIYVVVFGLQMQNESVIQFLSTTEGSPACYISALDNFGHLLQCIQKNKPINKFAKYIARITNGLHNYVLVNPLPPAASAIIDTFTFTKNGQYDTIISVLKDGNIDTISTIDSTNILFNTSINAVFELLNQAQTNTLDNNVLISKIKICFKAANPTYYNMIFK